MDPITLISWKDDLVFFIMDRNVVQLPYLPIYVEAMKKLTIMKTMTLLK